jgi:hypothetical protein
MSLERFSKNPFLRKEVVFGLDGNAWNSWQEFWDILSSPNGFWDNQVVNGFWRNLGFMVIFPMNRKGKNKRKGKGRI